MHAVGRHGRPLDGCGRRAVFATHRRGQSGGGRLFLRPDLRQPHRLREARQSRRARNARCGDRQDPGDAGKPAFIIHTGDVSHTAKPQEFDDALQLIGRAKLDVHYAPGEHDILDPTTQAAYLERFGKGATGGGWYAFDHGGVHFVSLVNVVDLKTNGLGSLGAEQLAWLDDDLSGKSASTPIVVFSHIPLWMIAPEWGWGTEDSAQALRLPRRFGSVTVLNGHIHQLMQKVEGNVTFHTARSTAFPQPAPGPRPLPAPSSCRLANCANGSASERSPTRLRRRCSPSPTGSV